MRTFLALILCVSCAFAGPRGSLDPRTAAFSDRVHDGSGVAPTIIGRAQIMGFVCGSVVVQNWSALVCWPLRSSQNAGTGTVVYSLGGLGDYPGTLVNGPTWGADGITFVSASSQWASTSAPSSALNTMMVVFKSSTVVNYETPIGFETTQPAIVRQAASLSFGVGNPGLDVPRGDLSVSQDVFLSLTGKNSSTTDVATYLNGGSKAPGTMIAPFSGSSTSFNFARHWDGFSYADEVIAFGALISSALSDQSVSELYSLYKSTLGQGLGLP